MRIVIPHPGTVIGGAIDCAAALLIGAAAGLFVALVVWASVVVALGAVAWASTVDGIQRLRPAIRASVRRMLRRAR